VKHKLFFGPTGGKNSNALGTLFYNGKVSWRSDQDVMRTTGDQQENLTLLVVNKII
jgi:hypothetical protein